MSVRFALEIVYHPYVRCVYRYRLGLYRFFFFFFYIGFTTVSIENVFFLYSSNIGHTPLYDSFSVRRDKLLNRCWTKSKTINFEREISICFNRVLREDLVRCTLLVLYAFTVRFVGKTVRINRKIRIEIVPSHDHKCI